MNNLPRGLSMPRMRPVQFRFTSSGLGMRSSATDIVLWRRLGPFVGGPGAEDSDAVVARIVAHQFGGTTREWMPARAAHGRPELSPGRGVDLSVSHSGQCWMLAVTAANRRIGMDIEEVLERPNALAHAEQHFPPEEVAMLARLSPANLSRAFLRLWCAREAVLKAHGRGLGFGLDRMRFELTPRRLTLVACDAELGPAQAWRLREFCPAPGLVGVVAWLGPAARLRGYDANFANAA